MTQANRLTLFRLALVPAFMAFMVFDHFWTRVSSLLIFIGASITDWYDGRLARRTGTVTVVGTFLDPLVDKMLIAAALVGFVELHELNIPAWMVVLIISREFLITGLRSVAAARGIVLAADGAGKFKMASQVTAIIAILLILVLNSAFEKWPPLSPARTEGWPMIFREVLERAPFWMVFWVSVLTIISGCLYIRKYQDLLRREFSILKSQKT
jgi:CDP-diacylglycerol--glycerol-3-phosphate 3-phosphatidyltransferase